MGDPHGDGKAPRLIAQIKEWWWQGYKALAHEYDIDKALGKGVTFKG